MDGKIRDLAARLLKACGAREDAECAYDMFPTLSERMRGAATHNVWGMAGVRRLVVPTLNVLLTNIVNTQTIPEDAHMRVESDFSHLFNLKNITEDTLRPFPTRVQTDLGSFDLLPEQLALVVVLALWPCASSFHFVAERTEGGSKRPRVATLVMHEAPDDACDRAAFSWLLSTMGSGKTTMATLAACFFVEHGWERCAHTFPVWNALPLNGVASMPRPGSSVEIARVVLIAAPTRLMKQWERNLRAIKPQTELVVIARLDGVRALGNVLRERVRRPDTPAIVLVDAHVFLECTANTADSKLDDERARAHGMLGACDVAVAAIIMDEFDTWAGGARADAGGAAVPPFISAFRTFAVTATPVDAVRLSLVRVAKEHFFKTLVYEDASIRKLDCANDAKSVRRVRSTWVRFTLSNPAPEVQIACGEAAAAWMSPVVDMEILRVPYNTMLTPYLSFGGSDARKLNWWTPDVLLDVPDVEVGAENVRSPWSIFGPSERVSAIADMFMFAAAYEARRRMALPSAAQIFVSQEACARVMRKCGSTQASEPFQRRLDAWRARAETNEVILHMPEMFCGGFHTRMQHVVRRLQCAVCGVRLQHTDPTISTCCTSAMCDACAPEYAARESAQCWCCRPVTEGIRSTTHALLAMLASFFQHGCAKVCVFTTVSLKETAAVRLVDRVVGATDAVVFHATSSADCQDVLDAFRTTTRRAVCHMHDDVVQCGVLSGADMGFCDGVIVLGHLENEQQAFSRVIRMGTSSRATTRIARVTFDVPTVTVRCTPEDADGPVLLKRCPAAMKRSLFDRVVFGSWHSSAYTFGVSDGDTDEPSDSETLAVGPEDERKRWLLVGDDADDDTRVVSIDERRAPNTQDYERFVFRKAIERVHPIPDTALAGARRVEDPSNIFITRVLERCIRPLLAEDARVAPALRCELAPAFTRESRLPFVRIELDVPPVVRVDGDAVEFTSVHFQFARPIECECVPDDAGGLRIERDASGLHVARWCRLGDGDALVRLPIRCPAYMRITATFPEGDVSVQAVFDFT